MKLQLNSGNGYFDINSVKYPKGQYKIQGVNNAVYIISIENNTIEKSAHYSEFLGIDGEEFNNSQECVDYLSNIAFKSGGGDGSGVTTDASQLTSGTLNPNRIGNDSIGEEKLSEGVRGKLGYEAVERESNTVLFDQDYIIGNAAPRTGDVLFNFTGAVLGSCTVMVHEDANPFTLPDESVVIGGEVKDNVPNYIYFLVVDKTEGSEKVHVTISQEVI